MRSDGDSSPDSIHLSGFASRVVLEISAPFSEV